MMDYQNNRYMNDVQFRMLVDYMEGMIHQLHYTPSEMRDAALLASINYEMRRPNRTLIIPEAEAALHTLAMIRDKVEANNPQQTDGE
jgi:hypothetical protein